MTLNAFADEPDGWEPQYDWEDWEDFEPGRFFWPDPSEAPGESDVLHVDFVLEPGDRRLAWATTIGLWRMGLPELVFRPPRNPGFAAGLDEARFAHFLGRGPTLAAFLGPEVDTVIQLKCSLWP
jgi:hypothetical protein